MRIDTPENMEHLRIIFPLIPRALERAQAEIDPAVFLALRNPTRSAIIHDLVMAEAETTFGDNGPIRISDSRGLRYFALPDSGLRLHRGGSRGRRIAINRTRQTREWYSRPRQLVIDGFLDPNDRFHLVYVPDPTWSRVANCVVGLFYADKAVDTRDIDVDAWYEARGATPFVRPEPESEPTPRIALKPAHTQVKLDGSNDSR